jgi:hypothetical protein
LECDNRTSRLALVVTACVAYIFSKFIATAGGISLDQTEYWLLGLVPIIFIMAIVRATHPSDCRRGDLEDTVNFLSWCWIASLLCFLFLRTTLISEAFEFPLYRSFQYHMLVPNFLLSCWYTALGYGMISLAHVLVPHSTQSRAKPIGCITLCLGAILNAAMFDVLLFFHVS